MRQLSEAARNALRAIASGYTVLPDRFRVLKRAGFVARRGHGRNGRWWLREAGKRLLAAPAPKLPFTISDRSI